jgi:4-hydroxybutyrate CoA-transferase
VNTSIDEMVAAKTTTADQALRIVESGMRVFLHGAAATPEPLINAMVAQADRLRDVEITHLHTHGDATYTKPEYVDSFRVNALFIAPNTRDAINEGRGDYIPIFLSEIPRLFKSGTLQIDVALLTVSPPDEHGYVSLGSSVDVALAAAESARFVIGSVSRFVPRTLGNSWVHISRFTHLVQTDAPLAETKAEPLSDCVLAIGENVASLIDDGSTLQLGIGAIPNAVLHALRNKRDLGIHTEMFSDGVVDLVECGVITGARKSYHPYKIVSSFVAGSRRVFDFIDNNPMIELHPVNWVNDGDVIRRNSNMVAVNSAIEMDLTGQVAADSIGTKLFSGIGGQLDFMRAAALSPGGKPIIALPSTAKGQSRIVSLLKPGAGVVTTRGHVHFVVTEFGVADLYGKNLRQRAAAMIAIAHPDHRAELTRSLRDYQK